MTNYFDYLRTRLEYDPETGVILWKSHPAGLKHYGWWDTRFLGKEAGSITLVNGCPYRSIRVDGELLLSHRVAWMIYYSKKPTLIDHIDGNTLNNSINNLRDVDHTVNGRNCKMSKNNTSGVNGVYWHSQISRWCAEGHYTEGGAHKKEFLGSFRSLEDAAIARIKWENSQGNFTFRHGKEGINLKGVIK